MPRLRWIPCRRALAALLFCTLSAAAAGCGAIPFDERPAAGYTYRSQAPLVIAVVDETGGGDWSGAVDAAKATYADAVPNLRFQSDPGGANIVITVRQYVDAQPPELTGYRFQPKVAAFVAVYDIEGNACNFPPSPLPVNCNGEIARGDVYLNDAIVIDPEIEARRLRLVLHEFGHAMGLTRHSASLGVGELEARYGW